MMFEFISGEQVIKKWDIVELGLFRVVSMGKLRPYDKTGKPLPHPDYDYKKFKEMLRSQNASLDSQSKLVEKLPDTFEEAQSAVDQFNYFMAYFQRYLVNQREGIIKKYHAALSRDLLGWKDCPLPEDRKEAEEILNLLKGSLYSRNEIEKYSSEMRAHKEESLVQSLARKNGDHKLRKSRIHKLNCRTVAAKLWNEDPSITIADMILRDEIAQACEGKLYSEKALRNWIKDLCPDRSPGRRPKVG